MSEEAKFYAVVRADRQPYQVEPFIRDLIAADRVASRRVRYWLKKWSDRGWYDYGVAIDLGWLTPEAPAVFPGPTRGRTDGT